MAKKAVKTDKVVDINISDTDSPEEAHQKMKEGMQDLAKQAAEQIDADYATLLKKPKRHQQVVSDSLTEFVTLMQHVLGMDLFDGQKAFIMFKMDRKAKGTEDGEIENGVTIEVTSDVPPVDKQTAWTLDSSRTLKRRSFRFRCDATGNHVLDDLPLFAELAFAETGEVASDGSGGSEG